MRGYFARLATRSRPLPGRRIARDVPLGSVAQPPASPWSPTQTPPPAATRQTAPVAAPPAVPALAAPVVQQAQEFTLREASSHSFGTELRNRFERPAHPIIREDTQARRGGVESDASRIPVQIAREAFPPMRLADGSPPPTQPPAEAPSPIVPHRMPPPLRVSKAESDEIVVPETATPRREPKTPDEFQQAAPEQSRPAASSSVVRVPEKAGRATQLLPISVSAPLRAEIPRGRGPQRVDVRIGSISIEVRRPEPPIAPPVPRRVSGIPAVAPALPHLSRFYVRES